MTLYVIECNTPKHFYVGLSNNIANRIGSHCFGNGSSWTKIHGVNRVVSIKEFQNETLAKYAEMIEVKRLSRIGEVRGAGITSAKRGRGRK